MIEDVNDGNGPSRLDRIEQAIENLAEQHLAAMAELKVQRVNIESLHNSAMELHAIAQEHNRTLAQDGETIRALTHIAQIHERRSTDLEGGHGQ